MHFSLRLAMIVLFAAFTCRAATTTSSSEKTASKSEAIGKKESPAKPDEKPVEPSKAAVSTISIEDLRDFDKYPKQVQSLVQSALALTHLELGYLYGSHDPAKGGMDCSGTVYHMLHFQGLKDVPRQSDEMCQWVEKKTQLHLTPTATAFDSDEFADLKPGDLLFWTNTTETKRKLPVTHVMIYLGKLKKTGKRVVFGASDGRSFHGERRSGVSVFDFNLPKAESPSHFYGYGHAPGLVPKEPKPVIVAASKAADDTKPAAVEKPAPKSEAKPELPKEEVRKAVAIVSEAKPESKTDSTAKTTSAGTEDKVEVKKATVADATPKTTTTTTTTKPKTTTTKKNTTTASSTSTKRRTPAPPPKSVLERKVDQAVSSIRRFFRN
ncbi:NlpC/P60 family protein [Prosthecobacter sp.]|uniref:NlpC/P60 family protein n=1 Tax=Prosthecobacter sp. TaxID=1965333 RepID=UPI001D2439F6|nr:NlpC/P60 family protein [Prosthecobacter sp.]MCB1279635.1 C40 family peptidase [Prosthecobacter sp.]